MESNLINKSVKGYHNNDVLYILINNLILLYYKL